MPEDHRVAVIIPCGGHHGQFIAGAVQSCLDSTDLPDAIIVVDDASAGFDPLPAHDILHVIMAPKHIGRSAARNLAAKEAKTEWLFFLDADDVLEPTALSDFRGHLDASSGRLNLLYADYDYIDADGTRCRVEKRAFEHRKIRPMPYNYFNIGMFVRRGRFIEIGGFDEDMTFGEYWDLALRYIAAGNPPLVVKNRRPLFVARAGSSVSPNPMKGMADATRKMQAMILGGYYDRPKPGQVIRGHRVTDIHRLVAMNKVIYERKRAEREAANATCN